MASSYYLPPADLLFGYPIWITEAQQRQYFGRRGRSLAKELTQSCCERIIGLLRQGCY